ncbi:MAG: GNAT family N-acetyltransferase [Betaproteobacteria bacterium]|jgi:GNAT superfamily N-acetyltransferase|nr:GNAT family N-acetyltransferase [Betaproteobacteria bacterium]MDH5285624.1 GNAT family N-acetyltransferase [Betaproteobacteria bacterium]
MPAAEIRHLAPADVAFAAPALAELFLDAVADGASIGYMSGLAREDAEAHWLDVAARPDGRVVLVAEDADGIAGTVTLVPAREAFQPHRAEIVKLVVHRRARGRGVAAALMEAAEREARTHGRTHLTLMTRAGSDGERLYRRSGWTLVGIIPQDSLAPDGTLVDAAIFRKQLRA